MTLEVFKPTLIAHGAEALTPDALVGVGMGPGSKNEIKAAAFDVDGTLMNYHGEQFDEEVKESLLLLGSAGIKLFIISNAYDARVDELDRIVTRSGLPFRDIYTPASVTPPGEEPKHYRKPRPDMLQKIMKDHELNPKNVLMIGDQLAKDIVSANRADVHSLLVPRRGEGDDWRVRQFQRPVETLMRPLIGLPRHFNDFPRELVRSDAPKGPDGRYFKLAS